MKRYPLLDPFRLILALVVVFRHLLGWQVFPAVPAFLALSGFLVLQSFDSKPNWKLFAWKRFLRVYPALFAMFVVALFLAGPARTWEIALYYLKFGFGPNTNWNVSLWSLPFEEVFYVLLGVLYLTGAYTRRGIIWMGALIGALLCVYGLLSNVPFSESLPRALPLVWSFFVGNLCYLYRDLLSRFRFFGLVLVALAIATQLYGVTIQQTSHFDCLAALFAAPGILLIGTQFSPNLPRIPDFSYSCYIWHYLLGCWCISIGLSKWMLFPFLVVVCVSSWYLIERPALRLKHRVPRLAWWQKPVPADVPT